MGASSLRLLAASAALAVGLVVTPAVAADAVPVHPIRAVAAIGGDVPALTERERVLDATAQRSPEGGMRTVAESRGEPPVWLLVLLAPILLGGVIAAGVTLRRHR